MPCAIISIKPAYAFEIINGVKDCEVRAYRGEIGTDTVVYLYASKPLQELVGHFRPRAVFIGSYDECIRYVRSHCPSLASSNENLRYVINKYRGYTGRLVVIEVAEVKGYKRGLKLRYLREALKGFRVPRSYKVLGDDDCKVIEALIKTLVM